MQIVQLAHAAALPDPGTDIEHIDAALADDRAAVVRIVRSAAGEAPERQCTNLACSPCDGLDRDDATRQRQVALAYDETALVQADRGGVAFGALVPDQSG